MMPLITRSTSITVTICVAILAVAVPSLEIPTYQQEVLRYGTPESVGMLSEPLKDMVANLTHFIEARNWGSKTANQIVPIEPGGTTLIAHDGVIVSHFAFGKRNLWASVNGSIASMLPPSEREDTTIDTIYDIASLTKLYTTVAGLRYIDKGLISLNSTMVAYLPTFATNGKENITILQLMTHTSGLPADPTIGLWMPQYPTYKSRVQQILNETLKNAPGSAYLYSDINYMAMMLVIEEVTGKRLDDVIHEYTSMMGMEDTFFNRGNIEGSEFPFYYRVAAEEFQTTILGDAEPQRPQPVRGTVHDENAWGLDGVSGHAGLFSTVLDTARFGQMILNNGTYGGKRILSQKSVDLIFTNFNVRFGAAASHGVGFELNQ
ncbi:putative beta-lactamase [Xylaria digitata]|nr:putative beta-lactamase [Xylaria digitata]